MCLFFFSSRRRHTRCALVTGVQTCALPISLGARVADVALVPECHVLEANQRIGAQQARQPADTLGEHRVALVRHGARPLLAATEWLERLAHLRALEVEIGSASCRGSGGQYV